MFVLKPSFAAGELSPALYGRTDLSKYDVGAADLTNFLVLRYGGIKRRPGLKHIAVTHDNRKARLIPFSYSIDDSYVIEITPGKFRFYRNGQLLSVTVDNDYSEWDLPDIKYTQSADVLFLTHPNHWPMTLTRLGLDQWAYEFMDISNRPFEDVTNDTVKISASGYDGNVTLTADQDYFTEDMESLWIRLGHTMKSQYIKVQPTEDGPQTIASEDLFCPDKGAVYFETFGFWSGNVELQYYDDSVGEYVTIRSVNNNHGSNVNITETNNSGKLRRYRVYSSDFDYTLWSSENPKQKGYVVIQCFATHHYGMVQILNVNGPREATGYVAGDRLASTEATKDFSFQSWTASKGFPACVGFFEDRICFAGTRAYPQSYWLSDPGDYYRFTVSTPQQSSDSISGTLNNGQMNGIKAMVTFGELIFLTAGGEYKLSGGNEAITPTNQQSKAQEYRGINNLTPIVAGSRIIYVQQMGSIVRDLGYQYDQDKYTGDDVSLLASHLFEGHQIVGLAYQQTPNSIVWCVRDDGVLLGLTYIKEQDVYAWHKHTTQGKFIDVCSIAGENEDRVYFLVERDGQYYVELMASQIDNANETTQYYVDNYSVAENTNVINGLDRLNGKKIQILADGNVMPEQVVENGSVQLGSTFNTVIAGLGYESNLTTMPIEFNGNDGTYQSRKKRLSQLMVYFKNSRGGLYGMDPERLDEIKWRSTENYNAAIKLYSGKKYVVPPSTWTDTLQLIVKQNDPLPMSILSIVPEIQAGG